jgi:hypothetical protein
MRQHTDGETAVPEGINASDTRFQRLSWRAERIAWTIGLLLLIAALLGAFGNGILASAKMRIADVELSFERIQRAGASAEYRITHGGTAPRSLHLTGSTFDPTNEITVFPPAAGVRAHAAPPGISIRLDGGPLGDAVTLRVRKASAGVRSVRVSLNGENASKWVIVLP